jgi:hypothetical protein
VCENDPPLIARQLSVQRYTIRLLETLRDHSGYPSRLRKATSQLTKYVPRAPGGPHWFETIQVATISIGEARHIADLAVTKLEHSLNFAHPECRKF